VSCSVWPLSLLEAAFFCYSSTALAGGYSCVTLTPYPLSSEARAQDVSTFLHQNNNNIFSALIDVFYEQASSRTL